MPSVAQPASSRVLKFHSAVQTSWPSTRSCIPACVTRDRSYIAETDPSKQLTEIIGSGRFRRKADERVQGSFFAYVRFDHYMLGEDGEASFTAGSKIVRFDRFGRHVQPDATTKVAAMQVRRK